MRKFIIGTVAVAAALAKLISEAAIDLEAAQALDR